MGFAKLCSVFLIVVSSCLVARAGQNMGCGHNSTIVGMSNPIRIGADVSAEERAEKLASVREWIWTHWRDHKAGQRVITMFSVEGRESRSRILVNRDCSGIWRVTYHIDRYAEREIQDASEFEAYDVERVQTPFSGGIDRQPTLGPDKIMKPTEYRLIFRDKDGRVLRDF
jgi:hypothetical protein